MVSQTSEKITIFENIGGFLVAPKKQTKILLGDSNRNWTRTTIQSVLFILFSSAFAGCVLMFYMMYPEVFWVPGALHTGRLFVYAAADPLFILGMLGLGIFLVLFYDYFIYGSISYSIMYFTWKQTKNIKLISYTNYLTLYSFTFIFTTLFHMFTVIWMYFFEKFSYAKIFFPVTDFTLPVIIHLMILGIIALIKWIWELRVNLTILNWSETPKSVVIRVLLMMIFVKIAFTAIIVFIVYLLGNLIAGAQWG